MPEAPAGLPPVAILGAGSMGGAVLAGLQRAGSAPRITATVRSAARADEIAGVRVWATEADPEANRRAVAGAGIVILAVKPKDNPALLAEIAPALEPFAVVVSVAAGVTTAAMEALVPNAVVRAMPNTPIRVGRGVTGIAAGSRATPADLDLVRRLFHAVGAVLVVPEDRIDALTAIAGSGPAYVFHAIEQWTRAAMGLGFTLDEARLLVEETFRGSSELLAGSGAAPAELRRRVTSPGGTTEAALRVLDEAHLAGLYARAAAAAIARARELGA